MTDRGVDDAAPCRRARRPHASRSSSSFPDGPLTATKRGVASASAAGDLQHLLELAAAGRDQRTCRARDQVRVHRPSPPRTWMRAIGATWERRRKA